MYIYIYIYTIISNLPAAPGSHFQPAPSPGRTTFFFLSQRVGVDLTAHGPL